MGRSVRRAEKPSGQIKQSRRQAKVKLRGRKERPGRKQEKREGGGFRIQTSEVFSGGQNRLSMFLAATVAVILTVVVSINGVGLYRRLDANRIRIDELKKELESEEERTGQIEEYRKYTQTDAYIEEIAREKLGLVYEGEIVFRQE